MRDLWVPLTLIGLVGLAMLVARPAATVMVPRLGAVVEVLSLLAIGLMPPVLLACAAATWASASGSPGHMVAGVCVLSDGPLGRAQIALYGLAAILVARTGLLGVQALRAARRTELQGLALQGASARQLPDGTTAWIVPSERLAAYSGGLRHPKALATSGLLGLLDPTEQEAVLRHEVAHVRLGHPRIVLVGAVIARSYRWLPPARLAWSRLRRDLEAAADDEVVGAVGADPLLRALAKVALAEAPPATVGFADPEDLRFRIRRLQQRRPPTARRRLTLGLLGAVLVAGLALAACQALHAGSAWSSLVPCLASFGYLGYRPTWALGVRR